MTDARRAVEVALERLDEARDEAMRAVDVAAAASSAYATAYKAYGVAVAAAAAAAEDERTSNNIDLGV